MEYTAMDFLQALAYVCLPIGIIIARQIGNRIADKMAEKVQNEKVKALIQEVKDTMNRAVNAVNQTYVDNLKYKDAFNDEEQAEARRKSLEIFWKTLSAEAYAYVCKTYDNVNAYVDSLMEESVGSAKKDNPMLIAEGIEISG